MGSAISTLGFTGTFAEGSGTTTATPVGVYQKFFSGAGVGNAADLTQDALWTLTAIPANTLTVNGDSVRLTLEYATGATANNKAFGMSVGGTASNTVATAANNVTATGHAMITRVDATHVNVFLAVVLSGTTTVAIGTVNQVVADLTANTLAIVVTGASPTTGAANDVKLFSGTAEIVK